LFFFGEQKEAQSSANGESIEASASAGGAVIHQHFQIGMTPRPNDYRSFSGSSIPFNQFGIKIIYPDYFCPGKGFELLSERGSFFSSPDFLDNGSRNKNLPVK
jgi:hypothetical protein